MKALLITTLIAFTGLVHADVNSETLEKMKTSCGQTYSNDSYQKLSDALDAIKEMKSILTDEQYQLHLVIQQNAVTAMTLSCEEIAKVR